MMNKATTKRLFSAIGRDDQGTVESILRHHPDGMETVGEHNRNVRDKTPLMYAMQCRRLRLAHALLDRGANAAAVMPAGPCRCVLSLCAEFAYYDKTQHDEWIQLAARLLDQGADPTTGLWPALHAFGAIVDRADLIRLLLLRGANADQLTGNSGSTVRELVAVNRRKFTAEVLGLFCVAAEPT
jgi:hypothetical protein